MAKKKSGPVDAFRKRGRRSKRGGLLEASKIVMIERQFQVVKMRRDGFLIREIAETLNVTEATVRADLVSVLGRTLKETAETTEESRQLQIERLDQLIKTYTPFATQSHKEERVDPQTGLIFYIEVPPSPTYANLILAIEARRAKLLALDIPEIKKVEHSGVREYVGVDLDKV